MEWVGGLVLGAGSYLGDSGGSGSPFMGGGGKEKVSVLAGAARSLCGHSLASLAGRAAQPAYSPVSAWASERQDGALGAGGWLPDTLAGRRKGDGGGDAVPTTCSLAPLVGRWQRGSHASALLPSRS